jgi:hypothetical protein
MQIESHEENKKCVLSDEVDDNKSSHAFTDEGERNLEETSKYINREDSCTVPVENHRLSLSVLDVHRTGCCGPVSPPVLGEDLSNRELHYAKLPSGKEDGGSEEKEMESNFLSDADCRLSSSHLDQQNIVASESPLSISHPLVSKSLTLPGSTDGDCLSHISGQKDTANSDCAHLQSTNLQVCEKSKPETSSASIILSDASSSSSPQKQSNEPKTQTPLPTFTTENDTDNLDEDRTSPSLLEHLTASQLDSISENSEISGIVNTQLTNINNNGEKSDHAVHTTQLTRNELISSENMVTQIEAGSSTMFGISGMSDAGKRGKLIMRKFVRKVSVSSCNQQKHGTKSVPPDVITLE